MIETFKGKTVLITGHTGFKGSWLSVWMVSLGAKVVGVSLDVPTIPSNYSVSQIESSIQDHRVDIRDNHKIQSLMQKVQPDFVFHLAAQALVRPSYVNPIETITTNAVGTANILDALRILDKDTVVIMITSDKAYDNVEWMWGYRETDRLGGKDPYSASKGMAELAIRTFFESFFNKSDSNVRLGIARAGNVIGGGDWAIDRIVPDCMNAWSNNKIVDIRNPNATRPWQHVLEPLSGYISLATELSTNNIRHGEAYNFGPSTDQNYSVRDLINEMSNYWDQVKWNDASDKEAYAYESELLKLNCDKAFFDLNWHSTLKFEETIKMTVEWYKHYYKNTEKSMYDYTIDQINQYVRLAKSRSIAWAKND